MLGLTCTYKRNRVIVFTIQILGLCVLPVLHGGQAPLLREQRYPLINSITIEGLTLLPEAAVRTALPLRTAKPVDPEKPFSLTTADTAPAAATLDPSRVAQAIKALYALGYFRSVKIEAEPVDGMPNRVNVYIILQEKYKIDGISYKGMSVLTADSIEKKLQLSQIRAVSEGDLYSVAGKIKRMYEEKGYLNVRITPELTPLDDKRARVVFVVEEGVAARLRRIDFKGNSHYTSSALRRVTMSKEDWILGFMGGPAGKYHPDVSKMDAALIENFYKSRGYYNARVTDMQAITDSYGTVDITYTIDEGDLYTIREVNIPGNDILSEEQLKSFVPLFPGAFYSQDAVRASLESLKRIWGEYGFIYAQIIPEISADPEDCTVSITLRSELGERIYVRDIHIQGNQKAWDKVIRRELFDEGILLTTRSMDDAKRRVESLGYFEQRGGVNWRIVKVDKNSADLYLDLREVKTGKFNGTLNFNGKDFNSEQRNKLDPNLLQRENVVNTLMKSIGASVSIADTNFLGSGIFYAANATYARNDQAFDVSIGDNWLFDRPIAGATNLFVRKSTYEDFFLSKIPPTERVTGGNVRVGFRSQALGNVLFGVSGGIEQIKQLIYPLQPIKVSNDPLNERQRAIDAIVLRSFQSGALTWLSFSASNDLRNHPTHPTQGYQWLLDTRVSLPNNLGCKDPFGDYAFGKITFDGRWYTPIIQEYDVVFHLHGFFGWLKEISNHNIPYRELFHIGGANSVRGFSFGEIGPSVAGSSLGSRKAFFVNAELQFPITPDYNMMGALFYDGGAGWSTPADLANDPAIQPLIINNNFSYRHSLGIAVRVSAPVPVSVAWGFKLDRRKRLGESPYEVHITASQQF